jgi:hypothetical protein
MSQHSGSVSPLSEHPASPALLTNHGPHRHASSPQAAAFLFVSLAHTQGYLSLSLSLSPFFCGLPCAPHTPRTPHTRGCGGVVAGAQGQPSNEAATGQEHAQRPSSTAFDTASGTVKRHASFGVRQAHSQFENRSRRRTSPEVSHALLYRTQPLGRSIRTQLS